MRLMPSLPAFTLRARKSFHAPWSMAALFWLDCAQRSHSSALGAASAARERAMRVRNAAARMGRKSWSLRLGPRRRQMILEPGQQVGRDLVAAGVVEQFVASAGVDLHADVAQADLLIMALERARTVRALAHRVGLAGDQQRGQGPGHAAQAVGMGDLAAGVEQVDPQAGAAAEAAVRVGRVLVHL